MKRGDLVRKSDGASYLNKVGVVLRVIENNANDNKFVVVILDGEETSWYLPYVEVISESR